MRGSRTRKIRFAVPGAPGGAVAPMVSPVARRIHSEIWRALACSDGSALAAIVVAALITNPSPLPRSSTAGTGTSAGSAGPCAAGGDAGGGGPGRGCDGGTDGGGTG